MHWHRITVCLASVFTAVFLVDANAQTQATQCDEEIAHKYDHQAVAEPVEWKDIDSGRALNACLKAVAKYPDSGRLNAYLARAYNKVGDYENSLAYAKRSSELGYPFGHYFWAIHYVHGDGVEKDPRREFEIMKRAAEAGLPIGIYNIAKGYLYGDGVSKDVARAERYLERAVELGVPEAFLTTGEVWEKGLNGSVDLERARHFYRKAQELGYDSAARIERVETALAGQRPGSAGKPVRPLPDGKLWVQVASRQDLDEAVTLGRFYANSFAATSVFTSENGWHAIVTGTTGEETAEETLNSWKKQNLVPLDTFATSGNSYRTIAWSNEEAGRTGRFNAVSVVTGQAYASKWKGTLDISDTTKVLDIVILPMDHAYNIDLGRCVLDVRNQDGLAAIVPLYNIDYDSIRLEGDTFFVGYESGSSVSFKVHGALIREAEKQASKSNPLWTIFHSLSLAYSYCPDVLSNEDIINLKKNLNSLRYEMKDLSANLDRHTLDILDTIRKRNPSAWDGHTIGKSTLDYVRQLPSEYAQGILSVSADGAYFAKWNIPKDADFKKEFEAVKAECRRRSKYPKTCSVSSGDNDGAYIDKWITGVVCTLASGSKFSRVASGETRQDAFENAVSKALEEGVASRSQCSVAKTIAADGIHTR